MAKEKKNVRFESLHMLGLYFLFFYGFLLDWYGENCYAIVPIKSQENKFADATS